MDNNQQNNKKNAAKYLPIGIGYGMIFSTAFTIGLDNMAIDFPLGMTLGAVVGLIFYQLDKRNTTREKDGV